MPLSDKEILNAMEAAIVLLGTADGASMRGDAVLHAARKLLAGLILHLNGTIDFCIDEHLDVLGPDTDPSTLQ